MKKLSILLIIVSFGFASFSQPLVKSNLAENTIQLEDVILQVGKAMPHDGGVTKEITQQGKPVGRILFFGSKFCDASIYLYYNGRQYHTDNRGHQWNSMPLCPILKELSVPMNNISIDSYQKN